MGKVKGADNFNDDDLETVFSHVLVEVGPKALGRGEMDYLIIQNPLTNVDGTQNTAELFVGSATNMLYFMLPGQESPTIYAEDLKDIYIRLNFPAVNPNGVILTLEITDGGLNYTVGSIVFLLSGASNASVEVLTIETGLRVIALSAGGTGYLVGDIVTVDGGVGGEIEVLTIGGAGEVLTFEVVDPGDGYALGNGVTTTGGAGVGFEVDIDGLTNTILTVTLLDGGSGYTVGQELTGSGGGGAESTFEVLTVDSDVQAESADVNLLIYRKRKGGLQ